MDKYDCILVGIYSTLTAMYAIKIMKSKKIPFIIETDGGYIKKDNFLSKIIKKYFISNARLWLSPSKISDEYLTYYGAKNNRIIRYPFTSISVNDLIQTSEEKKIDLRRKMGINSKYVILSIGQFIYRKGFDILIDSISELYDDVSVCILGAEATEEFLKKREEYHLENRLSFPGFKSGVELQNYFQVADCFVLPTREDIWGLVINEAMSYGLPVVTTDKCIAGLELIESGINGFIVSSDDMQELANSINKILADETLRKQMSKNNINKMKTHSIEEMVRVHQYAMELFKEM